MGRKESAALSVDESLHQRKSESDVPTTGSDLLGDEDMSAITL